MNIALYLTNSRASAPFPWQKREVCRLQRAKECLLSTSIHPPTGQENYRLYELIFPGICKAKGQFLGITYPAVIRWLVSRKTYFVSSNNAVKTSWTAASSRDNLCSSTNSHIAAILQGISSLHWWWAEEKLASSWNRGKSVCFRVQSAMLLIFWFLKWGKYKSWGKLCWWLNEYIEHLQMAICVIRILAHKEVSLAAVVKTVCVAGNGTWTGFRPENSELRAILFRIMFVMHLSLS